MTCFRGSRTAIAAVVLIAAAVTPLAAAGVAEDYKAKCAACHAEDGSGNTVVGKKIGVRDFHSAEVGKETDAQLMEILQKGKDKMPAYGSKLSADQLRALLAYVRELGSKK